MFIKLEEEYQKSLRRYLDKIQSSFFCQDDNLSFFRNLPSLQQFLLYQIQETDLFASSFFTPESLIALLRIWRSNQLPLDLMRLPLILFLSQPLAREGRRLVRSEFWSYFLLDITESSLRLRKCIFLRVKVYLSLIYSFKGESNQTFLFQRKQPCYLLLELVMPSYLISWGFSCQAYLRLIITTACPYFLYLMARQAFYYQLGFQGLGVG